MTHISEIIEDILVEWSYRVHDGMPKVNDTFHLVILEDILQERKYPRLFIEKLLQIYEIIYDYPKNVS